MIAYILGNDISQKYQPPPLMQIQVQQQAYIEKQEVNTKRIIEALDRVKK
jgi:hypothetical protein